MIPQADIKTIQPIHGKDLILTIDSDLQYLSESLCEDALISTEALNCSIVFSYANSGEILIAAEKQSQNIQSYDIDLISLRAIYEPGSSLKIFSIGAGIEYGLIDENTRFVVNDFIEVIEAVVEKKLDQLNLEWHTDKTLSVVLCSKGYPEAFNNNEEIKNLDKITLKKNEFIFHAGTMVNGSKIISNFS